MKNILFDTKLKMKKIGTYIYIDSDPDFHNADIFYQKENVVYKVTAHHIFHNGTLYNTVPNKITLMTESEFKELEEIMKASELRYAYYLAANGDVMEDVIFSNNAEFVIPVKYAGTATTKSGSQIAFYYNKCNHYEVGLRENADKSLYLEIRAVSSGKWEQDIAKRLGNNRYTGDDLYTISFGGKDNKYSIVGFLREDGKEAETIFDIPYDDYNSNYTKMIKPINRPEFYSGNLIAKIEGISKADVFGNEHVIHEFIKVSSEEHGNHFYILSSHHNIAYLRKELIFVNEVDFTATLLAFKEHCESVNAEKPGTFKISFYEKPGNPYVLKVDNEVSFMINPENIIRTKTGNYYTVGNTFICHEDKKVIFNKAPELDDITESVNGDGMHLCLYDATVTTEIKLSVIKNGIEQPATLHDVFKVCDKIEFNVEDKVSEKET
jgi:hypothetical protein